ncbi:hypothetical protein VPH35_037209 [Triticum aestivum]
MQTPRKKIPEKRGLTSDAGAAAGLVGGEAEKERGLRLVEDRIQRGEDRIRRLAMQAQPRGLPAVRRRRSAAAGWLEARGGPDPARGRSDPSAGDARISSAMGVAGDGARQWRPLPGDTTPAPSLPNLLSTRPRDAVACSSLPNPPHHAPLPVNIGFYFPILISSSARKKHGEDSEGRWQ